MTPLPVSDRIFLGVHTSIGIIAVILIGWPQMAWRWIVAKVMQFKRWGHPEQGLREGRTIIK